MPGMAAMLLAVVDHGEPFGGQGGAQPGFDFGGDRAFQNLGHGPYIGPLPAVASGQSWPAIPSRPVLSTVSTAAWQATAPARFRAARSRENFARRLWKEEARTDSKSVELGKSV